MPKDITQMTDEELANLSDEEMAQITASPHPDTPGDPEGDEGADGASAAADGAEPTDEEIQALLSEQEEAAGVENDGRTIPYNRFAESRAEIADLKLMLKAALELRGGGQQQEPAPAERDDTAPLPLPEAPQVNLAELRKKVALANARGADDEEIEQLVGELTAAEEQVFAYRSRVAEVQATNHARATIASERIQTVAATLSERYKFLDPNDKSYDDAIVLAINAKAQQYVNAGIGAAKALLKAGEEIGARFAKLYGAPAAANTKVDRTDPRVIAAIERAKQVRHGKAGAGVGAVRPSGNIDLRSAKDSELPKEGTAEYDKLIGRI